MSPSPISSPRTTSGASTPLTGGSGSIPFNHLKQSVHLHEGLGGMVKPSGGLYVSIPSYHDGNAGMFRGKQLGSQIFSELVPGEKDILKNQLGWSPQVELYDGHSVLAERVSQQLMRDHAEINPSFDLNPKTNLAGQINGI